MSHELTIRSNGKAEMAYLNTNEAPWHGLGNPLERGLSIEQWTIAAGMDFRIQRSKVRYFTDRIGVNQLEWPEKHVLFRGDTHEPLGVVSAKYKVVQPREVLEFFRDLCESNHFELSTAGTLFGGAKYWALAKVGDESYIADKKDKVVGNLLLTTAADGSSATVAKFVATCVVCNNTLAAAIGEKTKEVVVSHRSRFNERKVKFSLGVVHDQFEQFINASRELAHTEMDAPAASLFFAELLNTQKDRGVDVLETSAHKLMMSLFKSQMMGINLAGRHNTAWGAVNAVTEYVDHHARAHNAENRLNSAWFGRGDALKTAALNKAVAMAIS